MSPDLSEAQRLISVGFHLVPLVRNTKRPEGRRWNEAPPVSQIDQQATGYGMPLSVNGLISIDPDHVAMARTGMSALGFDLEELMSAGVRTKSTRPDSGGRSTFLAQDGLNWVVFRSSGITVLELRATAPNLQDCVPGVVYFDRQGEIQTQTYANGRRLDEATPLPPKLAQWWHRCSSDRDFLWAQQRLFFEALGLKADLSLSTGSKGEPLAFPAPGIRGHFNAEHTVESILDRHGYTRDRDRYRPPQASGTSGVRCIPGKDDLWRSDHASDPLHGTFDAWIAHVVLDHGGDVDAAVAKRKQPTALEPAPADWHALRAEKWISGEALLEPRLPVPYLVDGWIPAKGLGILYGASQSYKTFTAVDIAMSVACGVDWQGHETQQGEVAYIAGESRDGILKRIEGWHRKKGPSPKAIHLHKTATNIMDPGAIAEIERAFPFGLALLVIDTFRRNIGPSGGKAVTENSADDFGQACNLIQPLIERLGCSVLILHHTNKSGEMSGTGAFMTNSDFVIRQEGNGGTAHGDWVAEVISEKVKEDELPPKMKMRGEKVHLGPDRDTLVFTAAEATPGFDDLAVLSMSKAITQGQGVVEKDDTQWLDKKALAAAWSMSERQVDRQVKGLIQRGRIEKRSSPGREKALFRPR